MQLWRAQSGRKQPSGRAEHLDMDPLEASKPEPKASINKSVEGAVWLGSNPGVTRPEVPKRSQGLKEATGWLCSVMTERAE
ncbi:hypothetical protein KCU90_g21, partial [Aureobasidium melanogenum]